MEERKTDEQAIPFIIVAQDGTFQITEAAMEWLRSLGDLKVSVTTVVGPWRSGKSFLASLLCNRIDMFKTGSSVQPQTRGFWIAAKAIKKNEEFIELVMDTEGLFSTDRGGISDINIALLAVLLSSQFVYNTMGLIKDSVIRQLGLVSQITNHFYISEDQKDQDHSSIAPNFLWVLRDTTLVLKTGQTPSQYLEQKLSFESSDPSQRELYQGILDFFKSRACFTLVRPITDDSKLKYLSGMRNSDLRPEFNKGMDAITRWFDINSRPKMLRGRPLTASTFLGLAQQYIRSINEHATPIVMNSLDNVLSMEVVSIKEETLEYAKDLIYKRLASTKANLPNQSEVDQLLRKIVIDAQIYYFSKIFEILDFQTSRSATESIRVQLLALIQSARNQQFEKSMKSGYQFLDHQHISTFVDSKLKVDQDREKQIKDLIAFINKKYQKYKINPGGMAYAQSLVISFKEAALPAFNRLAEELKNQLEQQFTSYNQQFAVNQVEINSKIQKNKKLVEEEENLNQEIERQTSGLGELNLQEKAIKRQQETQKKDYESNLNSLTEIYLKKSKELHEKKDKEQKELIELFERKNMLESQLQHIKAKKDTED